MHSRFHSNWKLISLCYILLHVLDAPNQIMPNQMHMRETSAWKIEEIANRGCLNGPTPTWACMPVWRHEAINWIDEGGHVVLKVSTCKIDEGGHVVLRVSTCKDAHMLLHESYNHRHSRVQAMKKSWFVNHNSTHGVRWHLQCQCQAWCDDGLWLVVDDGVASFYPCE